MTEVLRQLAETMKCGPGAETHCLADSLDGLDIASLKCGMERSEKRQVAVDGFGQVFSCAPDDDVASVLDAMAEHRVRRLPVLAKGRLVGLVSLNDLVLEASPTAGKQKRPTFTRIVKALQSICSHGKFPVAAGA